MKISYKQRIIGYFLLIFTLFAIAITLFEQSQEKKSRVENLESQLNNYAEIIHALIRLHQSSGSLATHHLREIEQLLPQSVRVTIISTDGKVIYDKDVNDISKMENHLGRPEIMNALYSSHGSHIRMSASVNQEYLYYAKYYTSYYVRVALPYNIDTKNMLKANNLFIYIILALFAVVLLLINYAAERFSKSIIQLKNFASQVKNGRPIPSNISFAEDELGDIGNELTDIFKQMETTKQNLETEKEKLIRHFQFSGEGICIYNPRKEKIYTNTLFIQYLNLLTDHPTLDANELFTNNIFKPVCDFTNSAQRETNHLAYSITQNGKTFSIQTIVFHDNSFEVTIKDISKQEKTRFLKQEMTSNIAHELRTPVTSLRGYLETLNSQDLDSARQKLFIQRAFLQSIRLSNLIEDVSMISKIEEAPSLFTIEKVNLPQLIDELRIDVSDKLIENKTTLHISIPGNFIINGNYSLLYSIFRNLTDNTISYAGQAVEIHIENYMEDENYYYFSYYDTGAGVSDKHLNRLFERFYRVNEGRTRDTGGSGLGLSIVKNAILFHKGNIQVKNHAGGGLEFLFTLKKQIN
ncbi:MAG: two-component sensor histidine kinase [Tannerellaceae bacterium]|jgi:two-component system OmpR family sensor kinase/two-component system phosphate regulon sensor histidine kinase PhoR|nr:two-component sensor histidine kinase [Tannerellaceae bacterium]